MKRSPLKRTTPLRAKSPWRPVRRPLPRESAKHRAQRRRRKEVEAEVLERDGGCVAAELVPSIACRGALVVHEPPQRSVVPGSHLDPQVNGRRKSVPLFLDELDPTRGNHLKEPSFECSLVCTATAEELLPEASLPFTSPTGEVGRG